MLFTGEIRFHVEYKFLSLVDPFKNRSNSRLSQTEGTKLRKFDTMLCPIKLVDENERDYPFSSSKICRNAFNDALVIFHSLLFLSVARISSQWGPNLWFRESHDSRIPFMIGLGERVRCRRDNEKDQ